MKIVDTLKSYSSYEKAFLFSFIPFFIQILKYVFVGIFYPLLLGILILSPFLYSYFKGHRNFQRTVKYWSILIICYGAIRLLLSTIMYIDSSGVPSAAYYQFTFWYTLKSMAYVVLGAFLLIKRKSIFLNLSQ